MDPERGEPRILFLDARRWTSIIALLSMDATTPHHGAMGLRVPPEPLLRLLRAEALESIRLHGDVGLRGGPWLKRALAASGAQLGEEAARELIRWGRVVFKGRDDEHPELFQWQALLARCHQADALWTRLRLPAAAEADLRHAFARSMSLDACEARRAAARQAPRSDWDLAMHVLLGLDDEADEHGRSAPERWIEGTTLTHQGRTFWAEVLSRLSAPQQQAMREGAIGVARELGLLQPDEVLMPPSTLGETR